MIEIAPERRKVYLRNCRLLSLTCVAAAIFYVSWLLFEAKADNIVLFYILVGAELFNITQAAGFWYSISMQKWTEPETPDFSKTSESVDVFITVCGEPPEVVKRTIAGAVAIRHPRKEIWVLDDGRSAAIERIAKSLGANYLVRTDNQGAKAGNLNNAIVRTSGDFVAIFDADHIPQPDFLEKTMGGFDDPKMAFVQTPQSYRNRDVNRVAGGAHDQLSLFYGPILRGKNSCDAVFSCGTNVVFSREALEAIGGVPEDSITEDLRMSLLLIRLGYKSVYVPTVLAHGLGPVDVRGYFSQQMRWARGGLDILLRRRPFSSKMSASQALQYWLSFIYWYTGWAYAAYLLLPFIFLTRGLRPVQVPNQYPIHFLPYVFVTLFTIAYASNFKIRFRALWFTLASFPITMSALVYALFGRAPRFVVTSKASSRRSLRPVAVHVLTILLMGVAVPVGLALGGGNPSVVNNVAFALGHLVILQGFVRLAWNPEVPEEARPTVSRPIVDRPFEPAWSVVSAGETAGSGLRTESDPRGAAGEAIGANPIDREAMAAQDTESGVQLPPVLDDRPPGARMPLDVNAISLRQLSGLPGVSRALARRICQYRIDNGQIENLDELLSVPGVGPKLLLRLRDHLTCDARMDTETRDSQ